VIRVYGIACVPVSNLAIDTIYKIDYSHDPCSPHGGCKRLKNNGRDDWIRSASARWIHPRCGETRRSFSEGGTSAPPTPSQVRYWVITVR